MSGEKWKIENEISFEENINEINERNETSENEMKK